MPIQFEKPREVEITMNHDDGTVEVIERQEFYGGAFINGIPIPGVGPITISTKVSGKLDELQRD